MIHQYRLDVAYFGKGLCGFQRQDNGPTVQEYLEKALEIIFRQKVIIRGASRTDSGVHAENQVVTFRSEFPYKKKWLASINALTPPGIGIKSLYEVPLDFDPISQAKSKAYRYRLWWGPCYDPFQRDYVWQIHKPINLDLFQKTLASVVGEHNFFAFCQKDSSARNFVRTIYAAEIRPNNYGADVWFLGSGFLKQMIRILIGTIVQIAQGVLRPELITDLLSSGLGREAAGLTAPALGLCLVKIFYENIPELSEVV